MARPDLFFPDRSATTHDFLGAIWLRLLILAVAILPLTAAAQTSDADDSSDSSADSSNQSTLILLGGGAIPPAVSSALADIKADQELLVVAGSETTTIKALLTKTQPDRHIRQVNPADPSAADTLVNAKFAVVDTSVLSLKTQVVSPFWIDPAFGNPTIAPVLQEKLSQTPGTIGLGLSPNQAVVIRGRKIYAAGESSAVLILPASVSKPADRPIKRIVISGKNRADIIALKRAAQARMESEFPPQHMTPTEVPFGALLACGGGDLPDSIWKRFINLAGGPDAPIVFLTAAQPNPEAPNPRGLDRLKNLGCTHLTVLTEHTKDEVRSERFISALKQATGVWLAGGRQWRYVDAFENTQAETLFHEVLKRGGVIGGSSAGAAIQSQYMVRGDPLTNKMIVGEGYERGLNFLPGTAIDVHVSERGRLESFANFIRQYPQLLGIAVDEKTGAEIRGHQLKTWGEGTVHIAISTWPSPLKLISGEGFDLKTRVKNP